MRAAYPGSFNPPTIAHLAIAESAWRDHGLARVDLIVSRVALGKGDLQVPRLEDRLAVLDDVCATRPWLGRRVTDAQLLADIAAGYDVLIVGADKWAQLADPAWYGGSAASRDEALARLPHVLVAPRPPHPLPDRASAQPILLPNHHGTVSSTAVRGGRREWMVSEAVAFDDRTGAWSDPDRYQRWLTSERDGQG